MSLTASCCCSVELAFIRPKTHNKLRFTICRRNAAAAVGKLKTVGVRGRIRAVRSDEVILVETEDGKVDVGGNGSYSYVKGVENGNGSVVGQNGSVVVGENESVVKFVNGNGNVSGGIGEDDVKEKEKKKTVEEIGQEEAWFKRTEKGKVEVYMLQCLC